MNFGQNTAHGFLPGQPDMESVLSRLKLFEDGNNDAAPPHAVLQERQDLLRSYVKTFSTPAGKKVLENLLDNTLRRSAMPAEGFDTIERTALHTARRQGQNDIIIMILKMLRDGTDLPPAGKK